MIYIRIVTVKGVTYLRAEDVAAYVRELAGSEETDVRNRLNQAAYNLEKPTAPNSGTLV